MGKKGKAIGIAILILGILASTGLAHSLYWYSGYTFDMSLSGCENITQITVDVPTKALKGCFEMVNYPERARYLHTELTPLITSIAMACVIMFFAILFAANEWSSY